MLKVRDTLKKIYTENDSFVKHVILFGLTGIAGMVSIPLNALSKMKNLTNEQWTFATVCFCITMLIGLYMIGYLYTSIHNSYKDENADILPKFELSPFKVGLKSLLIAIPWILYGVAAVITLAVVFALYKPLGIVLAIILSILAIIFFIMQPMLYVDFSREYNTKGLKNIIKPYTYIKKSFKDVIILLLKLLPIFLIVAFINILAIKVPNVLTYMLAAFAGYIGWIYNLVLNHGYAKILTDKFTK